MYGAAYDRGLISFLRVGRLLSCFTVTPVIMGTVYHLREYSCSICDATYWWCHTEGESHLYSRYIMGSIMNNRYGRSEGSPSEKGHIRSRQWLQTCLTDSSLGLCMDAQTALDYLISHPILSRTQIVSVTSLSARGWEQSPITRFSTVNQSVVLSPLISRATIQAKWGILQSLCHPRCSNFI
jgi:hypothetical protein